MLLLLDLLPGETESFLCVGKWHHRNMLFWNLIAVFEIKV